MHRLHRSPILFLLYFLENLGQSVISGSLQLVSTNPCNCLNQTLIYECTVIGDHGGATVWTGTALNCPSDEIILLHRRFTQSDGATRSCNNGATVAQSLSVQDNLYTSQLNVTIVPNVAGKSIMCFYDGMGDGTDSNASQFSTQIPDLLPSPNNLHISNANFIIKEFTFRWSPVASDCPAFHYKILASNCGSCPTNTNHTNVTCTDIPTDDGGTCIFVVQTVACGNFYGAPSQPITVNISATDTLGRESFNTNTVCIISTSSLAIALIVSIAISSIVIAIILRRSKAKIKATSELSQPTSRSTHTESMYEDITGPHSVTAIKTKDNVAYGDTTVSAITPK